MAKIFQNPVLCEKAGVINCCAGCGHGIATKIIYEVLEEMDLSHKAIAFHDLACGSSAMYGQAGHGFSGAHGRAIPTAVGFKRTRPDMLVFSYAGDGATYSIGMQHTVHTALRDEKITAIIINNTNFGMTGGQMSPATLLGQKTTSSPAGRTKELNGNPVDLVNLYHGMDIAYFARGAVDSVVNINKTKAMIRKAFEKQMAGEGFSCIEIMAPCPTNWGMTPIQSLERMEKEVLPLYPVGEYIERSAK